MQVELGFDQLIAFCRNLLIRCADGLLLLQHRELTTAEVLRSDEPLLAQPVACLEFALEDLQALGMQFRLAVQLSHLSLEPLGQRSEAFALGNAASLFTLYIAPETVLLIVEAFQQRRIDVEAIARKLVGIDRKESLTFADEFALFHVHLADVAWTRREDLRCAARRSEIADGRLFTGVFSDEEKCDETGNDEGDEPYRYLQRKRLECRNVSPLAVLVIMIERFLTEEGLFLLQRQRCRLRGALRGFARQ